MAKKISLINMKGGVGKSTLAVNLAWYLARFGNFRVLIVDLDPQFNASQYLLGVTRYKEIIDKNTPTIWNIFEQFTQVPGSQKTQVLDPTKVVYDVWEYERRDGLETWKSTGIDLIPSRLELAYSLQNPGGKERLLAEFISKTENKYGVIIIDCPPTESFLTKAAYFASDYILVPVKPEYLSSIGLPLLARSIAEFKRQQESSKLELAGVVFNATSGYVPEEIKSKEDVKQVAKQNGWYIFENEISYSRSYPKGAREGKPIFRTSYAHWDRSKTFQAFYDELKKRIEL